MEENKEGIYTPAHSFSLFTIRWSFKMEDLVKWLKIQNVCYGAH